MKDEFMALEEYVMFVAGYEAKLNAFSRYDKQLVTTEEERIHIFIKGLNFELQILSTHMTSAREAIIRRQTLLRNWRG